MIADLPQAAPGGKPRLITCQADPAQQYLLSLARGPLSQTGSPELLAGLQQHGLLESNRPGQARPGFVPLDPELIARQVSQSAAQRLGRIEVHALTASTQALAAEADGAFFAEHQTGGRGRRGRVWQSLAGGSLQFSIGWAMQPIPATPGVLPLAVAVAVAETLRRYGADASIKWPNDILCRQGKLAGILLEMLARAGQSRLVCGVGLNIDAPSELDQPAAGLAQLTGQALDRNRLAAELLEAIVEVLASVEKQGFSLLAERYGSLDHLSGRQVRLRRTDSQALLSGTVLGVAEDGALRLATESGERRCYSGEVQLERSDTC